MKKIRMYYTFTAGTDKNGAAILKTKVKTGTPAAVLNALWWTCQKGASIHHIVRLALPSKKGA